MGLPKYAASTPRALLVQFVCKSSCGKGRYGRVSKPSWTEQGPKTDPELFVICLRCGGKQFDSYNWVHV